MLSNVSCQTEAVSRIGNYRLLSCSIDSRLWVTQENLVDLTSTTIGRTAHRRQIHETAHEGESVKAVETAVGSDLGLHPLMSQVVPVEKLSEKEEVDPTHETLRPVDRKAFDAQANGEEDDLVQASGVDEGVFQVMTMITSGQGVIEMIGDRTLEEMESTVEEDEGGGDLGGKPLDRARPPVAPLLRLHHDVES